MNTGGVHPGTRIVHAGHGGASGHESASGHGPGARAGNHSAPSDRDERGYRVQPGPGPRVRTDVVDLYVFRQQSGSASTREGGDPEWGLLQVHRAKPPLLDTWQPVMGHIEPGESAVQAVIREAGEEIGLDLGDAAQSQGLWALEQVHPFYIAAIDCVVMSPRFLAVVRPGWTPRLNPEHSHARWVAASSAWRHFMWPGQMAAVREALALLDSRGPEKQALRVL